MSSVEWIVLAILGPIDLVFLAFIWKHQAQISHAISTGINRWLLARHKPEEIGEAERWCFTCRKPWPCAEWEKLHEAVRVTWDGDPKP